MGRNETTTSAAPKQIKPNHHPTRAALAVGAVITIMLCGWPAEMNNAQTGNMLSTMDSVPYLYKKEMIQISRPDSRSEAHCLEVKICCGDRG
jgi:hypothetical protein